MEEITLIFPDQLFEDHPALCKERKVYLVEEFLYFRIQEFHKQRLALLKGALTEYRDYLEGKGYKVIYLETSELTTRKSVFTYLAKKHIKKIHLAEINDHYLEEDIAYSEKKFGFSFSFTPSPAFFFNRNDVEEKFGKNKKGSHFFSTFYTNVRKEMNILMDGKNPAGGKFSFDSENRKKLPKNQPILQPHIPKETRVSKESRNWVIKHFPNSIGSLDRLYYPLNFKEAKIALDVFLKERLSLFGDFEDAISKEEHFLFHSVLSPLLNIGLLTPSEVVEKALHCAKKYKIPLNALEGFIRQIIGWREFIRGVYVACGKKDRISNKLSNHKKIPKGFWDGTTGIEPIDSTIKKILETGYCHHIERLMVLGNFLLLCDTDPNEVYTWFMAYFVDAYDWVMVPNVYDMSQYANLGAITTKPYISGANYILKMSNYKKGDWVDLWDGLFWRFMKKHSKLLQGNQRLNMLLVNLKKNQKTIDIKIEIAEKWLHNHKK